MHGSCRVEGGAGRSDVREALPGPERAEFGEGEVLGEPADDGDAVDRLHGLAVGELRMAGDVGGARDLVLVADHQDVVPGGDEVGLDVVGAQLDRELVGGQGVLRAGAAGASVGDDDHVAATPTGVGASLPGAANDRRRAPALTSQLNQLERAAELLRDNYRGIGQKLQAAQIQARMESEQKGERLTLSDPPVVPDHPLRPNRPLIIAGSIAAGFAFGLALVLLIELITRPIRGTAALRATVGEPPLAVIPDFDQRPSWIARLIERRVRRKSNVAVRV